MSLSITANRIWALFMIVLITTTSILVLRMLGLYEGFDASMAETFADLTPEEANRENALSAKGAKIGIA
jgi:CHASE2 domain-containing sensor protein